MTPRTPRIDEYGVVDPLRLPPDVETGLDRVRRMPLLFWGFVVLALVEVALETRALAPLSVDSLLGIGSRVVEILAAGAVVVLPTAVMFARPAAGWRDRLLLGTALVAIGPAATVLVDALRPDPPAAPGLDPLALAYTVAPLLVAAAGWLLLASAVLPRRPGLTRPRPAAIAVAALGTLGAVLPFVLDVVVAGNVLAADVADGMFDAPSYLGFSALASVGALAVVVFAVVAVQRLIFDAGRAARLAAVGGVLLALRLLPGPAVALATITLGTSDAYDARWAYSLASLLALAGFVLLLVAFASGYGAESAEEASA